MRYIPVNCLREGMVSGRQILGKYGELLLNKGTIIQDGYIKKIKELGYPGIYIQDEISEDVEVTEIISQDLRFKTVKAIKDAYLTLESGKGLSSKRIDALQSLVDNIISEVLSRKGVMINMVDLKLFDDYTFYHSVNVTVLAVVLGISLELNKDHLSKLAIAAMLHDIGKIFIPKEILNKPGKLTAEEFERMKTHSYKGYEYLKQNSDIPSVSYIGILQHHEKFDGTGYPFNTRGEQISNFGRIICLTDIYDALTSDRPYRKGLSPSEAIEYIMGAGGTIIDPNMARYFTQSVCPYPVGISVVLSNNYKGLVVENFRDCCTRPKIKVIKHGDKDVDPYIIDLRSDSGARDITIIGLDYQNIE